jgi:hypothetical protein
MASVAFGFTSKSVASILSELPSKVSTAASVPSGPAFDFFGKATGDIWQGVVLFPQAINPSNKAS